MGGGDSLADPDWDGLAVDDMPDRVLEAVYDEVGENDPLTLAELDDEEDADRLALHEPGQAMSDTNWDTNAGPVSVCHCHSDTPAGAGDALTTHAASEEGSTHPLELSVTSSGFPINKRAAGTP